MELRLRAMSCAVSPCVRISAHSPPPAPATWTSYPAFRAAIAIGRRCETKKLSALTTMRRRLAAISTRLAELMVVKEPADEFRDALGDLCRGLEPEIAPAVVDIREGPDDISLLHWFKTHDSALAQSPFDFGDEVRQLLASIVSKI